MQNRSGNYNKEESDERENLKVRGESVNQAMAMNVKLLAYIMTVMVAVMIIFNANYLIRANCGLLLSCEKLKDEN
jgi:hypothetical protein